MATNSVAKGTAGVGNLSAMAALDAGCARTTRPHWYTYSLVNGRASYENVFTPLFVYFFSFLFFLSHLLSSFTLLLPHVFPSINSTQTIMVFISA